MVQYRKALFICTGNYYRSRLAEILFNDRRAMLKVDCAEFSHSHEIARLIDRHLQGA